MGLFDRTTRTAEMASASTEAGRSYRTPVQIFIPLLEGEPASCDVEIERLS